jgi:hypothetical protein
METFCYGDVLFRRLFVTGDVLLRRRFVIRRRYVWSCFVEKAFCAETFCMCAKKRVPDVTSNMTSSKAEAAPYSLFNQQNIFDSGSHLFSPWILGMSIVHGPVGNRVWCHAS